MSTETPGTHEGTSGEEKAEVGGAGKSPSAQQITEEEPSWNTTDLKTLGKSDSRDEEQEDEEDKVNSGATTPVIAGAAAESYPKYEISCSSSSSQRKGSAVGGGPAAGDEEAELEDYSEDDTEVSSEAVVDDIELILMPEEVEDLLPMENTPKLVRVTELSTSEYTDEFLKMDDTEMREEDEEEYDEEDDNEYDDGAERDFDEEGDDEWTENNGKRKSGRRSFDKVHSGVQTDITALDKDGGEDEDDSCFSEGHKLDSRRRKTMTLTGVGLGGTRLSGRGGGRVGSKKLNWKSELTLLPSKTKMGFPLCSTGQSMDGSAMGFGAFNYASTSYSIDSNYPPDQYSSRVAKFTSQENMTSSGSQFLKPSTLYRTRNLSRNLNHFASSETTFMQDQPDSPRFQASNSALSTAANFKGSTSVSSNQICMTTTNLSSSVRRRPSAKNFRQSLPDLTSPVYSQQDNKRRQTLSSGRSGKVHHGQPTYSSGYRMQKRSSSDDETSSLIDESERCLRSSIDLLLTDDYPTPGYDYPYLPRSSGGAGGGRPGQQYTSGYYSARRSCSQPLLTDQGLVGEPRDSSMGSPFLPRTLKDMRCSRWAKVILPNGLVAVVCVKEMDEVRDCLTVNTETGCVLTIPFRKVVFAWRVKR